MPFPVVMRLLLWAVVCSLPSIHAIKGGSRVSSSNKEDYGYMVAWFDEQGQYFCAGSLITEQHVLTAAHCFMNISGAPQLLHRNAVAGVGIIKFAETFPKYMIADVHIHPSFTPANFRFKPSEVVDLAVVKLSTKVAITDGMPIEVVLANPVFGQKLMWKYGDEGEVQGWGVTARPNGPADIEFSTELQNLRVPLKDPTTCEIRPEFLNPGQFNDFNRVKYICGGMKGSSSSACYGDGGAPMVFKHEKKSYQIGVFSGLAPHGLCGSAGVELDWYGYKRDNHQRFVNVEYHGAWIQGRTFQILPDRYYEAPPEPPVESPPRVKEVPKRCGSTKACGNIGVNFNCWCDSACESAGDCCDDFASRCPKEVPTLEGSCSGHGQCGYKNDGCWCSRDCLQVGDCCSDYTHYCGMTEGGGEQSCVGRCGSKAVGCFCDYKCVENNDCCIDYNVCLLESNDNGAGSCHAMCGKRSGICWCDAGCIKQGDCCPNYESECGAPTSCKGKCGGNGLDCWCDMLCERRGDCCDDFLHYCPHIHIKATEDVH